MATAKNQVNKKRIGAALALVLLCVVLGTG